MLEQRERGLGEDSEPPSRKMVGWNPLMSFVVVGGYQPLTQQIYINGIQLIVGWGK